MICGGAVMNQDTSKTISVVVQTTRMTADVLKDTLRALLSKQTKHGKIRYGTIAKRGKLESIEVTENNIKDFLHTARKYDIDYALKRDSSTTPPTYHVFFTAASTEIFQKAFAEYASGINEKVSEKSVVNREQIKENSRIISQKYAEAAKERNLSNDSISGR